MVTPANRTYQKRKINNKVAFLLKVVPNSRSEYTNLTLFQTIGLMVKLRTLFQTKMPKIKPTLCHHTSLYWFHPNPPTPPPRLMWLCSLIIMKIIMNCLLVGSVSD